ncbi:MAG: dTMP kinase [Puniceicoccales bacterium]|jgi:dTMP kinase|nr:dTMP kinase [Puniceicoccales bacterium]
MAGLFVTLEGSEGTGKSSNITLLTRFLQKNGWPVLSLREPGGTAVGEEIRSILKRIDIVPPPGPEAELLLFLASRAQLVRERILPALQLGYVVLCDRYFDSTVAYQGGARSLDMATVRAINRFATGGCIPDVTFLLDLPPEIGFRRIAARLDGCRDRMEGEAMDFFHRVRATYLQLATNEPQRFYTVDAGRPLPSVQRELRRILLTILESKGINPGQLAPRQWR